MVMIGLSIVKCWNVRHLAAIDGGAYEIRRNGLRDEVNVSGIHGEIGRLQIN